LSLETTQHILCLYNCKSIINISLFSYYKTNCHCFTVQRKQIEEKWSIVHLYVICALSGMSKKTNFSEQNSSNSQKQKLLSFRHCHSKWNETLFKRNQFYCRESAPSMCIFPFGIFYTMSSVQKMEFICSEVVNCARFNKLVQNW